MWTALAITWATWLFLIGASFIGCRRRGVGNSCCVGFVFPICISLLILAVPRHSVWIAITVNGVAMVGTLVNAVLELKGKR